MSADDSTDAFTIERHGEVTLIEALPVLERMEPAVVDSAAQLVLAPLQSQQRLLLVVDLAHLDYFGSSLVALLIRCWRLASEKGGTLVLAGVSERGRDLLRLTSLDMMWPIYATRREAMESLLSD